MNRCLPILLFTMALSDASGAPAADEAPRFAATAQVHALGRSADGRFGASATVSVQPAATSADGRFVLKATHAPAGGCSPLTDPIFANGFEP